MTDEQKALRAKVDRVRQHLAVVTAAIARAEGRLEELMVELDRAEGVEPEPDGDAIGRLMRDEGLDFVSAVERLVQRRLQ